MVIALSIIAALIFVSVISLIKFMHDMAIIEGELIRELRDIKACLIRINEKQL